MLRWLVLAMVMSGGSAWAQDAEPMPGQKVFGACKACHQVGPTAKNAIGPQLNGLFGRKADSLPARKAGSVDGFAYSDANKAAGFVWDEAVFAEYIKDPKAKIPGTRMQYSGLKNERQVADLVAYLKTFGPDGTPGPK
jgi:cytochrome c